MFQRILIPTDFSTASEWVFDEAVHIAEAGRAELIILHVRMTWAAHPDELRFPADPSIYEYAEQQELERLRDRVRRANASLTTRLIVRKGPDPAQEIERTVRDESVDLIVVATHARHHVSHLLVGSTTVALLKDPPAPVLVVRYGIRRRAKALNRVVVPVHLLQTKHRALELAAREAKEIHLVTVCGKNEQSTAEALLHSLADDLPNATLSVIHAKNPVEEIVRHTVAVDADAIFLNAATAPSERKLDILRHAPVPVMVV